MATTATLVRERSSRWWRWYGSRLAYAAVVLAAGGALFAAAVLTSRPEPIDQATAPLDGTGLVRVSSVGPADTLLSADSLLSASDPEPRETRHSLIEAADGTVLVGERLVKYVADRDADRALRDALTRAGADEAAAADGFYAVALGCFVECRPAKIGRHGDVLIELTRLAISADSRAGRGDRALATVARQYADHVGMARGLVEPTPWVLDALLVAGGVVLLFAPFAIWHALVARRAPCTPHRHVVGADSPSPVLADVCAAACEARRRGRRLLAAQVAVFVGCGTAAVLVERLRFLAFVAPPLAWLVVRHFRVRAPRVPSTEGQVGFVRSGRLRLESLALRGASLWLIAGAWMLVSVFFFLLPALLRSLVFDEPRAGAAALAVDLTAVCFVCLAVMTGVSAMSRFARRLRMTADVRYQERRPRPELLYLRAFDDDRRMLAAGDFGARPATEIFSFRARVPYEEVLVRALDRHGVVVAIAEPGTPRLFLPLGPSRQRLSDVDWREEVNARMRTAALVVIAVGRTEGLLWEVATATRQGLLDRVLLVMPPVDDDELRARWGASAETIEASGGPRLALPVDPAEALVVRVAHEGIRQIAVADRRDEYTYGTAIASAVESFSADLKSATGPK